TVKAANQLIVAGNIQLLAEALIFLEAHGVDTEAATEVLGGGLAGSTVLQRKAAGMRAREFAPGFRIDLHHKDLGIVTAAAREAVRRDGALQHVLARHVEGAAHMADGYSRTAVGNIGVCVGTSGPAGTDMVTGLYAAAADSVPLLAITGQAPVARLHKEDFQA